MLHSYNLVDLMSVAKGYDGADVLSVAVGVVEAHFRQQHHEEALCQQAQPCPRL